MPALFENPDSPLEGAFSVYFSGVHVPAMRVSVQNAAWEMPQASIEVPSSFLLHRFGHDDRVQVAIFYKDLFHKETEDATPKFRLMFDGEITSYSRSHSAQGANVQFSAVSHVQIFAEMFVDFVTNVLELSSAHLGSGDHSAMAQHSSQFPQLFFQKGLDINGPMIRRPYDFIRNILGSFANNGLPDDEGNPQFIRSIPIQKFFDKHRKLIKLAKRFAACPVVEDRLRDGAESYMFPVIEAVGNDAILKALRNRAMAFANRSSLWQTLYMTFQMMFYDILFLNAAPFIMSDHAGNMLGKGSTVLPRVTDDHLLKLVPTDAPGRDVLLGGNTLRVHVDPEWVDLYQDMYEGLFDGTTEQTFDTPLDWDSLNEVETFPSLGQYITKPSNQFGIPPLCNVVFPSMVKNMVYNENYATQPTRMYIGDIEWIPVGSAESSSQMDVADNALRTGWPEEINLRLQALKSSASVASTYDQLLWPDEYFHGVIMSEEQGPSWLRFLANDQNIVDAATSGEEPADTDAPGAEDQPNDGKYNSDGTFNDTVTRLYSAYAKYRFYQEKYSRRRGNINMAFNPYIIAGLPMLYVDTAHTQEHMLAYVTSVSWDMSVGSMSTSVGYSFARSVYDNEILLRKKFLKIDKKLEKGYASLTQPDDPVYTLVPALNQYAGANEMYRRMLYQDGLGDVDEGNYTGAYQALMERDIFGADNVALTTDGATVPTSKYQLVLRPEFELFNDNYAEAMRFVSRPVCTIDEYIHFINGVTDEEKVELGDPGEGRYMYIRHYVPLDPIAILEAAEEAADTEGEVTFNLCTNVGDMAEVRANYEELLLRYHEQVYEQQHPNA